MDLTDQQWQRLESLIPSPQARVERRGRPPRNPRDVLNGILWVLLTGAPWKDTRSRYPPYQTCHRWHQKLSKIGLFDEILMVLAEDLRDRGGIDLREAFIDGSFAPAKKGAPALAKLSGGKGPRSWQLQTLLVFLSPCTWTALRRMK